MSQDAVVSNDHETVLPSLEAEAATAAALFLVQKNPALCREFFHHMMEVGEQRKANPRSRSAGGRVRAGYIQWAQWMLKSLDIMGVPVTQPSPKDALAELLREPEAPAKEKASEPTDPFERLLLEGPPASLMSLKMEPVPEAPAEDWSAIEADLMKGVEEDRARRKAEQAFILHMCMTADSTLTDLIGNRQNGLQALVRKPLIVHHEGRRAVVVQSFTVPFNGSVIRRDFKANLKPVVVRHPNMFLQADGQKLVRSKVFETKRLEFYVKVMDHVDGMIFKAYIESGRRDREDLAAFYQIRQDKVVDLTEQEYRLAENFLASGRSPYELVDLLQGGPEPKAEDKYTSLLENV